MATPAPRARFHAFLSYSSVDAAWAIKLKNGLERYGLKVWLDRDEVRPGSSFVEDLETGGYEPSMFLAPGEDELGRLAPTSEIVIAWAGATCLPPAAPDGVLEFRAGANGVVDVAAVAAHLAGKVVALEGGPSLAGLMVSLGLVDEFFLTLAPRVVSGTSARVAHGPGADAGIWNLEHGFLDHDGFLLLRYARA